MRQVGQVSQVLLSQRHDVATVQTHIIVVTAPYSFGVFFPVFSASASCSAWSFSTAS